MAPDLRTRPAYRGHARLPASEELSLRPSPARSLLAGPLVRLTATSALSRIQREPLHHFPITVKLQDQHWKPQSGIVSGGRRVRAQEQGEQNAEPSGRSPSYSVQSELLRMLRVGTYMPGDRLPSEMELAKQFDVAIGTLRKSLDELREQGVIETRRGRYGGSFVVRTPTESVAELRQRLRLTSVTELRDFADQHVAISTMIAKLCCQRADDDEILRLRAMGADLAESASPVNAALHDSRFHIELGAVSRSHRLMQDEIRLQGEFSALFWEICGDDVLPTDMAQEHERLLNAIGAGDIARAVQLAESHVRDSAYRLIQAKLSAQDVEY